MSINVEHEKQKCRESICRYFGNPIMTKLRVDGIYSIYYAKSGCMLCIDDRYILCIVENDINPMFTNVILSNLHWVCFQTRTISDLQILVNGKTTSITLKSQEKPNYTDVIISEKIYSMDVSMENRDRVVYSAESLPIRVELLFSEKDRDYSPSGTIQGAMDTFNCVLSFIM